MNVQFKRNDTGVRVLEVLKLLIKGPVSAEELMNSLASKSDIENIYAKETLLKYFNTLEMVGLFVEKRRSDGKYFLKNLPIETSFEESELKILCLIEGYVSKLAQDKVEQPFYSLLANLERSFSKTTMRHYNSIKSNKTTKIDADSLYNFSLIRLLEKYCVDAQKLKIGYLNYENKCTDIFSVEPKCIIYEFDRVYLSVYNPKLLRNQKLLLENIVHVEQLPQKNTTNQFHNSIVFELNGRLAKSYKLKYGEKVINTLKNSIVISNDVEDKNILFKRLIRYGDKCKILQPKSAKNEFVCFIDKIIQNLSEED